MSVCLPAVTLEDFRVTADTDAEEVTVRVIEIHPDRIQTTEKQVVMPVRDHAVEWKDSGCLLAMVLERHGKNGNIGYGFITGSCLKTGTVATTYFHDHHNLFVAGDDPEDMLFAVRRIQTLQGGFLTVKNRKVLAELALPVCGILSERGIQDTALDLKAVRESLEELGYRHSSPVMSLGTLGLPVSPALKLTDKGLVDVKRSAIVPLIAGCMRLPGSRFSDVCCLKFAGFVFRLRCHEKTDPDT
nr:adenine deaminase C-terminal domain-containing protein [uncultured Schaedlerella sp.]